MSGATASAADGSKKDVRRLRNNSGHQCTPVPLPALGTQRIIQGNGTNVGTVISLQCPARHRLVGKDLTCVMGPNSTQWVGGTYCQPLTGDGFRVAVLASIISSGVILFMSVAFITCCLLDCIKKETRNQSGRKLNTLRCEEQQEVNWSQYNHIGRNNNNNNNQEKMLPLWDIANSAQLCRCQQLYSHGSSPCTYSPPPSLAALPGHNYHQRLLPRNLDSSCSPRNPEPPPSSCQTPCSGLRSGSSWQYGGRRSSSSEPRPPITHGSNRRHENLNRTPEDISIRIISV